MCFDWTVRITDFVMILAVAISPFLAVFAQSYLDRQRAGKEAKLAIFKDLMATRRFTLSAVHVQALNRIDLEFAGSSPLERQVREKWRVYLDHLSSLPSDPQARQQMMPTWLSKNEDCLAELLVAMSKYFGHSFDTVYIKKGIYSPEGHATEYFDNVAIRTSLRELLQNQCALYTMLVPQNPQVAQEFQTNLSNVVSGKQPLQVIVKEPDSQ